MQNNLESFSSQKENFPSSIDPETPVKGFKQDRTNSFTKPTKRAPTTPLTPSMLQQNIIRRKTHQQLPVSQTSQAKTKELQNVRSNLYSLERQNEPESLLEVFQTNGANRESLKLLWMLQQDYKRAQSVLEYVNVERRCEKDRT